MKKLAKKTVAAVLGHQVRELYKRNDFKVVGVAGSIGKTSTKFAIAQTLSETLRVCYQQGNYNDQVTVPLVFFGEEQPSLFNPFAWMRVFWRNQKKLGKNYPYDVVVVELGSDGPGEIQEFDKYLKLDIAIVTAITPEHMQNFVSIEEVAKEELAVAGFSSLVLFNSDLCDLKYFNHLENTRSYGLKQKADFGNSKIEGVAEGKSSAEKYSLLAASAVASEFGIKPHDIEKGLRTFRPVSGRMQILKGVNDSKIIDDTYNSSPAAAKLALDYLYKMDAPQKIAVLGNMNELGRYSKQAHEEVGNYCNPKELELVITIGPDANKYLAESAKKAGCEVHSFESPFIAGEYLRPIIKNNAAILIKGSQNKVFAEEAIKSILANPKDKSKLVRQSRDWLKIKNGAFK